MIYQKLNKIISWGLKKKDATREGKGFGALLLPAVNQPVKSSAGTRGQRGQNRRKKKACEQN